jgi:hypothetical protein
MSANARMRLDIDEMEPDYCHVCGGPNGGVCGG